MTLLAETYMICAVKHNIEWWHGNTFCITSPLWGESTCGFPSQRAGGHKVFSSHEVIHHDMLYHQWWPGQSFWWSFHFCEHVLWCKAITWTEIDLSSIGSCSISQREISQKILNKSPTKISLNYEFTITATSSGAHWVKNHNNCQLISACLHWWTVPFVTKMPCLTKFIHILWWVVNYNQWHLKIWWNRLYIIYYILWNP